MIVEVKIRGTTNYNSPATKFLFGRPTDSKSKQDHFVERCVVYRFAVSCSTEMFDRA